MLNPCTMTLSEQGGNTITGTTSASITGSTTFSISFAAIGSKTLSATCSTGSGTVGLTVNQNSLQINSLSGVRNM